MVYPWPSVGLLGAWHAIGISIPFITIYCDGMLHQTAAGSLVIDDRGTTKGSAADPGVAGSHLTISVLTVSKRSILHYF